MLILLSLDKENHIIFVWNRRVVLVQFFQRRGGYWGKKRPSTPSANSGTTLTNQSGYSAVLYTHFTMCSHHARSYIVKNTAPACTYNASKCAQYILLASASTYDTADKRIMRTLTFLARLMRTCTLFTAHTLHMCIVRRMRHFYEHKFCAPMPLCIHSTVALFGLP